MNKKIVPAIYHEHIVPAYKGNPRVESLEDYIAHKDAIQDLLEKDNTTIEAQIYLLDNDARKEEGNLAVINEYIVQEKHLDTFLDVHTTMCGSYVIRYPTNQHKGKRFDWMKYDLNEGTSTNTSKLIAIIGDSGIGKSEFINRVRGLYPLAILHTNYQGNGDITYQIPILKVEMIATSSVKSLNQNIAAELDIIFSDGNEHDNEYSRKAERMSADAFIGKIKDYADLHSIGLIVFDEIQNISGLKKGEKERVMNHIVEMSNRVQVPMLFIGTPKAKDVFNYEMRLARRVELIRWTRMKNDDEWVSFVEQLFNLQYVRKPIEPTKEIIDALYYEVQGIVGLLKLLFRYVNDRAIDTGVEEISVELIHLLANEKFTQIQPMLQAIRNDDVEAMKNWQDIDYIDLVENADANTEEKKKKGKNKSSNYKKNKASNGKLLGIVEQAEKDGKLNYKMLDEGGFILDNNKYEE